MEGHTSLASYEKCVLCGCSKDQYEELKKRVADSKNRITMMETDYLQSTLRAENDLANCKEELRLMREKYARLDESHNTLQRTNQELEDKVLQVASKFEKEKQFLGKEMMTLTSRLVDLRCKLNIKEEDNIRLKKDCELAVQLLQCAPSSNFLTHKVSSLPHDLQYRVHKVMAEEFNAQKEIDEETQLYSPNDDQNPNLAGRIYDRVSTAVITKAMRMREEEENREREMMPVKNYDTKEKGTQTIQPFQGSLSAKTKKNIANGFRDEGTQIELGRESLENLTGGKDSDKTDSSEALVPNLMDVETADLIDFSQPPPVSISEESNGGDQPAKTAGGDPFDDAGSSAMLSSDGSTGGSSRRSSSCDSYGDADHVNSRSKSQQQEEHHRKTGNNASLQRKGSSHSSREIEYGPDLKQLSAPTNTTHPQQFKLPAKRGVGASQPFGKNRGPVKPGMKASHNYGHVGRPHPKTTPPQSPANPSEITHTDV